MDEQAALYLHPDSWLFCPTVRGIHMRVDLPTGETRHRIHMRVEVPIGETRHGTHLRLESRKNAQNRCVGKLEGGKKK